MPDWKTITTRPAGALPANLTTKAAVVLLGILVMALVLSTVLTGDDPEDAATDLETTQQPVSDAGMSRRLQTEIEQQQRLDASQPRASDREATRQRIRDAIRGPLADPGAPPPDPVFDPDTGEQLSPAEAELRDNLRLEESERRLRSLRAQPVAHSYRDDPAGGRPLQPAAYVPQPSVMAGQGLPDPSLHPLVASTARSADALLDALNQGGTAGDGYAPAPGALDVPLPDSRQLPDYDDPPRFAIPPDPPGWERIHEGSLVEAVLVNQLSGDFPSPVLALVAVPFYSADRQRVLIPRGSRFVGTAQPVRGQDQDSLAVGFHRVILPDGRHVPLRFQALNQIGEGALSDRVDRHYFSTFLAAGAVGVMSGLAAIGGSPYAGGFPGFQSGFSQGTAGGGQQIMRRFLNRLPEVTIRAGHRLRIWFTSDALFPTP